MEFLNVCHEHQFSLSTLKRKFKALDLLRRPLIPWRATVEEVNIAVQKELDTSGANLGYRSVWEYVRKTNLDTNVDGFQQRKRRQLVRRKYRSLGPHYVWQIDGHDKLKPFGFLVH